MIKCYEVIVVDDCSPYGEKVIVDTYLEKYSNLKYIRHDINKRQGGARNTGIRAAIGEYVMFLDSDDCIKYQNTFAILLEYLKKSNPVILRSNSYSPFSNDKSYLQIKDKYLGDVSSKSFDFVQWRLSEFFGCSAWATLYRREFLVENNLYFRENVLYEDTDWTQKVLYYAGNINLIDFSYYAYRENPNSITRKPSIGAFEGNVEGVIETYKFYKEKIDWNDSFGKELKNRFIKTIFSLLKNSRHYPISVTMKFMKRLNKCGLTSLKGMDFKSNIVLGLVHFLPILPLFAVKVIAIKRRVLVM